MCILSGNTMTAAASEGQVHQMQGMQLAVPAVGTSDMVVPCMQQPSFDCSGQPLCMMVFVAVPASVSDYIEPTGCDNNFSCQVVQPQWPHGYAAPCSALGDEASQYMWQHSEGYAGAPFPQVWTDSHLQQHTEGRCLPNELVEFQAKFGAAFPQISYLMEAIWSGGEARENAVQKLLQPGAVRYYSFHHAGSWLIELALETLDRAVAAQLASDLQGRVVKAMKSLHANFVIQKIIQVLRPSEVTFIVEEIWGAGLGLACHELGCRVFCRLLEHGDQNTVALMDQVLANATELIKHSHGKYVVEVALAHGSPEQRVRILSELEDNLVEYAFHANGSYVLQKVMTSGDQEQRESMALKLLDLADRDFGAVAHNYFGSAVVQAAAELSGHFAEAVWQRFEAPNLQWRLWSRKAGKRLRGILGVQSPKACEEIEGKEE